MLILDVDLLRPVKNNEIKNVISRNEAIPYCDIYGFSIIVMR